MAKLEFKKKYDKILLLGNEITRISEKRKITLFKILIQDDTIVCSLNTDCNQEQYQALMTWNAGKCGWNLWSLNRAIFKQNNKALDLHKIYLFVDRWNAHLVGRTTFLFSNIGFPGNLGKNYECIYFSLHSAWSQGEDLVLKIHAWQTYSYHTFQGTYGNYQKILLPSQKK